VDDSLLFASSDETMDHMKDILRSEWEVTDLGEPSKIVGIEVTRSDDTVTISQEKYIENVLLKEGMVDANPVGMPMDPHINFEPNPDDNELNRGNWLAKLLGSLQFISNSTRPDISYAVNRLAAYTANPGLQHHGAIKWILRYLAGTKTLGITYRKSQDVTEANNLFHGYADAAYANADDLKSTTGYVFLAGGGAVTWKSKKQTVIALSSTEAEYVALSEAGCEATWLRNLYGELGYPQKEPTMIKGDNDGSVVLTHNPQFHQRSKHITIRHHWV
jgi:Reverse transcriptase (RNA-dependent DNA polymerase)